MQDALVWLAVLAVVGLMFWSIARENERKRRRTAEEYERDVASARESMMRAGLIQLDQLVGNEQNKRAAVEYLKDEQQGITKTGGKGDDKDRTTSGQL